MIGIKKDYFTYYFRKNLQGDVIALLDSNGVVVVEYNKGLTKIIALPRIFGKRKNCNKVLHFTKGKMLTVKTNSDELGATTRFIMLVG